MANDKRQADPIPETFATLEAFQDFWDAHSLADYDDYLREVEFDIDIQRRRFLVALEPELAQKVAEQAHARGVSAETLVNLWLKEKLLQAA